MPDSDDDSPPAQQITDEEILRRVIDELDTSVSPFLTTSQAADRLSEIKGDQVRKRLKQLRNEGELASTKVRGFLWWVPEDANLAGEVDPEAAVDQDPDWDNIAVDEIPQSLKEEITTSQEAGNTEEFVSLWHRGYDGAWAFMQLAAMLAAFGVVGFLTDTLQSLRALPIPTVVADIGSILILAGFLVGTTAGVSMGICLVLVGLFDRGYVPAYPWGIGDPDVE